MQYTVDIIIITYNCKDYTDACIESIYATAGLLNPGIIVVDNNSSDGGPQYLAEKYPDIEIIRNSANLGYAKAVNLGAHRSNADYLIISNADVIYHEGAIRTLIDYLQKYIKVGACGPQQSYPDGSWQASGGLLPGLKCGIEDFLLISNFRRALRKFLWPKFRVDSYPKSIDYVDGACLATPREIFNGLGGFDEDYFFYSEEADYCYRLYRNYQMVILQPNARITHWRGASSGPRFNQKSLQMLVDSKLLFCSKNRSKISTFFYKTLEIWHCSYMLAFWKIYGKFAENDRVQEKINYYQYAAEAWRKAPNS